MREINTLEINQVAGGSIICGESIPAAIIKSVQNEAINDARKMSALVGSISAAAAFYAVTGGLMTIPAAIFGTAAVAGWMYNHEYTSSMRVLEIVPEITVHQS